MGNRPMTAQLSPPSGWTWARVRSPWRGAPRADLRGLGPRRAVRVRGNSQSQGGRSVPVRASDRPPSTNFGTRAPGLAPDRDPRALLEMIRTEAGPGV